MVVLCACYDYVIAHVPTQLGTKDTIRYNEKMVNLREPSSKEIVLILHNIRSVQNVGSLFRTADAFGVHGIYLSGFTPTPLDRFGRPRQDLVKTSLGAEQTVPWKYLKSAAACIRDLKNQGYTVVAIEQTPDSFEYTDVSAYRGKKVALFLGNEVRGVDARTLKLCDRAVEIPMRGMKESLNVSVAGAIVLSRVVHS